MYKVVVLYKYPLDKAASENYYSKTHLPLAAKIPDVDHAEFTKFSSGPGGSRPEFYRMAELYFATEEVMMQALTSNDGQVAAGDIPKFATGGFHFMIGKV